MDQAVSGGVISGAPVNEGVQRRRRRVRSAIAWVLLIGAALVLAFGWLMPIVRTDSRPMQLLVWIAFMVRTFTFHAGLAVAVVALYMLAFRLWKPLIAAVPLLAITLGPAALSYWPKDPPPITGPGLTLISCNLLVGSGSARAALEYIERENPDVVCFQEYNPAAHEVLSVPLKESYPHVVTGTREDAFGQAVYSKFELREAKLYPPPLSPDAGKGRRSTGVTEPQIRCVVTVDGREVVIQNVHDTPPASLRLLQEQLRYFEWLDDFIGAERRPVILVGDFNSTASTTQFGPLRRAGYRSTHELAGSGRGSTWVDTTWLRHLPGVRIDHIWVSPGLTCERAEVGPSIGSDHRPIIAKVGFTAAR
ncbi:MAG TPA: endonuclease/exonuclease/phosphatase family protein [Phycisphaerales bacterium]|nr:endonuclease/exonuclease/phosphatase family protein [Phycisphaerales bacterium]